MMWLRKISSSLARLIDDDEGQDLIEYALLTAFIGVTGIAAWNAIEASIGTTYQSYDDGIQDLWVPDDPQ